MVGTLSPENYYQSDPIRRRAFSTGNTAVWSIGLRDRGQENWTYIEESADYGACRGVSIPVLVPMVTGHRFVSVMVSVISKPTVYGRHRCCMLSLRYLTEACGKAFFLAIYI
ncbi:hypothetical protein DMH27_05565 [Raoultella planticola]|uniref:Transcription factor LuxR-like autoinducer-binding domain-containing protein n=1 Tax=Raoultella planticola TaxID=575 RepID=A0A5P6A9I0_RAOPL|nr:hypothetical protein [Raoultella planticola]QFG76587.1 hypothetical protein DMB90_08445 [Raoultella planticola]